MTTFMRLLHLVTPYRRSVGLVILLGFLALASSVALMATSAYLISRASLVTDVAELWIAIASVRLFAILRAIFRYFERLTSHRTAFRLLAHLRGWFFASIEPLAPARLSQHRSGDLIARSVADVETLENFYVRVLIPPISTGLAIACACAILGLFDVRLALVLLAFLLATGVLLPLSVRWLGKRTSVLLVATRAELNAAVTDQVQGCADLVIFDQRQLHRERLLSLNDKLLRMQERQSILRGASTALGALFASLAAISVLWLGIPLVGDGDVNGVYLALLPLTAIASFEAVQPLPAALQQLGASHAAGWRLFDVIDAAPDVVEPDHAASLPSHLNIEVANLSFRYSPADPLALDSVSFTLPEGTCTALVGPSGSGKSTVINLLLRFWELQDGSISIGGQDVRGFRADDVRDLFAVVPQDVYLFNATIRENLLVANPDATDEQLSEECHTALLGDFIGSLPQGFDTIIGENGLLLSGGERQRLAIARALLKDSPVFILDEPTANLDPVSESRLLASIWPHLAQRTTLIVSHREIAAAFADQVVLLENGRVVNELRRQCSKAPLKLATAIHPSADAATTDDG
jgi:ATP-binding cassette, subfamily C, bacterial CydC